MWPNGSVIILMIMGLGRNKNITMKTKTKTPKRSDVLNAPIHEVVKSIKGKKGTWSIWKTTVIGNVTYWTRLTARNGKVICGNAGFNTVASAKKNIKAVQASA